MSTETTTHDEVGHDDHADHPSDKQYIGIALILAFFTAIEVLTYFVDFGGALIPTLMVLMIIKFILVIGYFMHLKFDSKLFTQLFIAGLVLAIGVYAMMLSAFEFWA